MDIAIRWSNGNKLSLSIQKDHDYKFYSCIFLIFMENKWEKSRRLKQKLILKGDESVMLEEDEFER